MKKLIAGIVIGLTFSTGVAVAMKGVNPIYDIKGQPDESVAVFDDNDNKCYVAKFDGKNYGTSVSVSCVKK